MMQATRCQRDAVLRASLAIAFVSLCAWPYLGRLARPTLYTDDLVRLAIVRNVPLHEALVLPFNEHMAPLFELVSRAAWLGSGERLSRASSAFTIASALPWVVVLVLLVRVVKRRTGSTASALASVAIASLSWVHVEVVEWYSASSFAWALAGILLAFDAPGPVSLLASMLAPAFSAVGLMAGPMGVLGAFFRFRKNSESPPHVLGRLLAPVVGTIAYLLLAWWFGLGLVLSRSAEHNLDPISALRSVLSAPGGVLLPALVGLPGDMNGTWEVWEISGFFVSLIGCAVWALKDKKARPLILGGLALILGGYTLAYGARASGPGAASLLRVQRYHLLPQFGLAMLLSSTIAWVVGRLETSRTRSWAVGVVVAGVMLALHGREMANRALCYRFPDQPATLRALERLEPEWRRAGLTREQVIAALGADQTRRWCVVEGLNPWVVLGPLEKAGRVPNDQVVRVVREGLSEHDRAVLMVR